MSFKRTKEINKKFDETIESLLNDISNKNVVEDSEDGSEDQSLIEISTMVRDTLDTDGNVTGSVVERKEELPPSNIDQLKTVVAVKKDFNTHRKEITDTIIKAGLSVLAIGIMLAFEQNHSITTRSLSFLPKPKI